MVKIKTKMLEHSILSSNLTVFHLMILHVYDHCILVGPRSPEPVGVQLRRLGNYRTLLTNENREWRLGVLTMQGQHQEVDGVPSAGLSNCAQLWPSCFNAPPLGIFITRYFSEILNVILRYSSPSDRAVDLHGPHTVSKGCCRPCS
jgi:hypothetical protein